LRRSSRSGHRSVSLHHHPRPAPSFQKPPQIVSKLRAEVQAKETALAEYADKHGVRVRDGPAPVPAASAPATAAGPKGEGVLV
jgi:hypothetical protein